MMPRSKITEANAKFAPNIEKRNPIPEAKNYLLLLQTKNDIHSGEQLNFINGKLILITIVLFFLVALELKLCTQFYSFESVYLLSQRQIGISFSLLLRLEL